MKETGTTKHDLLTPKTTQRALNHLQALFNSLGQLSRSPTSTILTFIVIGIALALPMGLSVILKNVQTVSGGLHDSGQISLYLKSNLTKNQTTQLLTILKRDEGVASASYISPSQGLKDFTQHAGFGDVLKNLKANPIPAVIVVKPSPSLIREWQVRQLFDRIQRLPGVANAQFDMQWLKRLDAILAVAHRAVILMMIIFAFAVLLIIGNTIRLTTQSRHREILVIKLIGGTNRFIRRPFLYSGLTYGFVGAIAAWFIVDIALWFLQSPISQLASLYGSNYQVIGLGLSSTLFLLISGAVLGLLGSYLAVNRYISKIEPK